MVLSSVLYIMLSVTITVKYVTVRRYKGADTDYFLKSFFRLYNRMERNSTSNDKRRKYMRRNNALNRVFYGLLLLILLWFFIR